MCLLQSLTLDGRHLDPHFPTVMDLFAAQLFANLAKLTLKGISFDQIITFTNVPKLKSLVINYCDDLLFEFPEKIQLKSLAFSSREQAELLTHLLTQVRGLEKLHIGEMYPKGRDVTDLTSAIMLHKDTLRLFEVVCAYRGCTTISQIFPRLRLENLPNFYYGTWSMWPLFTIFRLSALAEENSSSASLQGQFTPKIRFK